jgi:hypothetical protein
MLNPTEYRACLAPRTLMHLRESCTALAEKQYFASAVWGAVFLEAILDDFAQSVDLPQPEQDDLNGRVQQLQKWSRNREKRTVEIPDEVFKRCHDIRNTRNRLVHDTGTTKSSLPQDAEYIQAALKVVLDWYQSAASLPTVPNPPSGTTSQRPGVRVFISTITPHNQRQEYFLEELMDRLRAIGIEPVRHVSSLYDKKDPISSVCRTIQSCRGLIAVGMERTHAYFLRDKEGTQDQTEVMHRQYTSGWLHLEAGIAHALGLNVFVLCQKQVHSDGIFDRNWNTYPVAEIESLDAKSRQVDEFLRYVQAWGAAIPSEQEGIQPAASVAQIGPDS